MEKPLKLRQLLTLLLVLALLLQIAPVQVSAHDNQPASSAIEVYPGEAGSTVLGEVTENRKQNQKHFRLHDGSFLAVDYGMAVHYENEDGSWEDIDNTLVLQGSQSANNGTASVYSDANSTVQGQYIAENGGEAKVFAYDLSSDFLFASQMGDLGVSMSLANGVPSLAEPITTGEEATLQNTHNQSAIAQISYPDDPEEAQGDASLFSLFVPEDTEEPSLMEQVTPSRLRAEVLYEDVYDGVDLLYELYGNHVKETIRVNCSQSDYTYSFRMETEGLTPSLQEDGSVYLADSNGQIIYCIPAPYMTDANEAYSEDVTYTLTQTGPSWILTVKADASWIDAPERVFPVDIDPTLYQVSGNAEGDIYAVYVEKGADETHGHRQKLFLGYSKAEGTTSTLLENQQIYIHFNQLPEIPQESIVVDASLNLWQLGYSQVNCSSLGIGAYEVTEDKPSDKSYSDWLYYMKWSNKASYDSSNMIDYTLTSTDTNGRYVGWDVTELFSKWYRSGTENRTLALIPTEELNGSKYASVSFWGYRQTTPPILTVSYRNNTGIEPYYTYQTMGAGHAGTAYISDYSNQLTVAKELFSFTSTVNSYAVQLVFNSAYFSKKINTQYDLCKELGMEMHVGSGWTYNFIQHVQKEEIDGTTYIRYLDGDGTIHYFAKDPDKPDDNYYYDEDGLGLKIDEYYTNFFSMTDDHGNEWVFVNGPLLWINDSDGNRIRIYYTNNGTETHEHYPTSTGARIERITQKNVGCSEVTIATFNYVSHTPGTEAVANYLDSITDYAGNVHSFTYNNGKLTSIKYNGTEIARYTMYLNGSWYQNQMDAMTDVEAGYTLHFYYSNHKISAVEESVKDAAGEDVTGVRIEVTQTEDRQTKYTDLGADRVLGGNDDITTYYGFDYFGRTVNAYSTDYTGKIIGASNAVYSGTGSIDRTNNRTLRTASIGVAAMNELRDHGFEDDSEAWGFTGIEESKTNIVIKTMGANELVRTGTNACKGWIKPGFDSIISVQRSTDILQADTLYTFSAYVNTSQCTNFAGDGIYLQITDGDGIAKKSEKLNYQTSSLVDDGWVRLSVTFEPSVKGSCTAALYNHGVGPYFYTDDWQIETGEAPSNLNLLENGNLQYWGHAWKKNGGTNTADFDTHCGVNSTDEYAFSLTVASNPKAENFASQTVALNLPSSQTYVLSGWALANAVPDNVMDGDPKTDENAPGMDKNKQFGLRAVLTYVGGAKEYHYAPFNPELSGWQFTSLTIVPRIQKTTESAEDIIVESIQVECAYEKNGNTAWFDNLSLVREAAQTMRYDAKGNLVSVTTTGVKADVDDFDENSNLISTTTGGNGTYHYTYDETKIHRLTAVSNEVVVQKLDYDASGNVIQTTLEKDMEYASDEDETENLKKLVSSSSYTSNNNLAASVTDTTGQTESYQYDNSNSVMTGQPTSITNNDGVVTQISYGDYIRVQEKEIDGTVGLAYNYTQGILSNVVRTDSEGNTQSYGYIHDLFGNLTGVAVGNTTLATYTYGPQNGYLQRQSYGNGDYVDFEYDNLGRTTRAVYSSGRILTYAYTGDGQMHSITDNNFTNDTADDYTYYYTYDTLGRTVDCQMRKGIQVLLQTHWTYDDCSRVQSQGWQMGNASYKETYSYSEVDGSLTGITIDGDAKDLILTYDYLQRLTTVNTEVYTKTYGYKDREGDITTSQIQSLVYANKSDNTQKTFSYAYNSLGFIETYTGNGEQPLTYTYDDLGQLTGVRYGNAAENGTAAYTYTYDTVGNIKTAKVGNGETISYAYSNQQWRDLLTAYDGGTIAYEGQTYNADTNTVSGTLVTGNPVSYFNGTRWNFLWSEGRNLSNANTSSDTQDVDISFTYDSNGLRTSKTVVTDNYEYVLVHSYTDTVVAPTCTELGYTVHVCDCGDTYQDTVVPALGHDYEPVKQAGTTVIYKCSRCGNTYIGGYNPPPIDPTDPPEIMSLATDESPCNRKVLVSSITQEHSYIYASGKLLRETITTTSGDTVTTEILDFQYDNVGFPYALTYTNGTAQPVTYYYITNMQGDVVYLVDEQGQQAAYYTYDPFGKVLSATGSMAEVNPLRYRGYFYDDTTGFYYLQSRYYDPAICRYINADCYTSTGQGFLGYNPFAYCANNPVNCVDSGGKFLDTIFDVVSIGFSVVDVICNPDDPWAWAGLAGDIIDLIPFVCGVGEATKAIGAVADVVDVMDDVHDAAKFVDAADDLNDAGKIVDNISDSSNALKASKKFDGGCTGGHCFVEGTLVLTDDGNQPIEDIRVGDYVWAWDEITGEISLKRVVETYVNMTSELIHLVVNGEKITTTPEHPFYSPVKGWTDAVHLRAGDILVLVNGEYVVVEKIQHEILEAPVTVYNFQVEDYHTYYVADAGVLVHNSCSTVATNDLVPTHELTRNKKSMDELVSSIKENGIQEPVKYVDFEGTKYIVDGHHRVAAAKRLHILNIPAVEVNLPYGGYKSTVDLFW